MLPCIPVEPTANQYATSDDFCRMFRKELDRLYGLLFLLIKDHTKAERCFVAGLEDCMTAKHVFKEFAHSWARRVLVQQAIRELQPRPGQQRKKEAVDPQWHTALDGVLSLETFDRFVLVLSVLERYSQHECSLLLSYPPRDIRNARLRALQQLANECGCRLHSGLAERRQLFHENPSVPQS